jgi:hypothetical protein
MQPRASQLEMLLKFIFLDVIPCSPVGIYQWTFCLSVSTKNHLPKDCNSQLLIWQPCISHSNAVTCLREFVGTALSQCPTLSLLSLHFQRQGCCSAIPCLTWGTGAPSVYACTLLSPPPTHGCWCPGTHSPHGPHRTIRGEAENMSHANSLTVMHESVALSKGGFEIKLQCSMTRCNMLYLHFIPVNSKSDYSGFPM